MKPFIPREWVKMRKQPDAGTTSIATLIDKQGVRHVAMGGNPKDADTWECLGNFFTAPYSPGEVCWVRETWRHIANSSHPGMPVEAVIQYSDMTIKYRGSWPDFANAPKEAWWNTGKQPWRSPVTMPQWASRRHVRILSCVPEQRDEWGWRVEWEEVK
jgi:hypothetical protein